MKFHHLAAIVSSMLIGACTKPSATPDGANSPKSAIEKNSPARKSVRQYISLPHEFTHITNLGSVDIVYTQGPFSVEAEGDSATISHLDVKLDSNILDVSLKSEKNLAINPYASKSHVTLYVSVPHLQCVSICGSGSFKAKSTWKEDDIRLGMLSTGTMTIDTLECTTFQTQLSDAGTLDIHHLQADHATLVSRSAANIKAHVDVKELVVLNEGKPSITLSGTANKSMFQHPDDPHLKNLLQ